MSTPSKPSASSASNPVDRPVSVSAAGNNGVTPTYATFTPNPLSLPQNTSPLLSSTPATVTKALSQAYPFIIAADYILGLLTWTSDDSWKSFLVVAIWVTVVLYFETMMLYLGQFLAVAVVGGYVWFSRIIEKRQTNNSSLDAIVHTLNNVTIRLNMFLLPLSSLSLTPHEISRFMFTTLFMSPIYIIIAMFVLSPKVILLFSGVLVFTYHSAWARVTRAVLWRSRTVKLITFYMTGLDFSGIKKKSLSEAQILRMNKLGVQSKEGKPVQFTYVLYENQRRWLGIGWTSNLLAYERTPWTDEFLNESYPPESFKLPDADGTGMEWRWVDKTWKLDLTNDGALVISGSKSKTTADPSVNDGYVYYDNTWKSPSAEDSYSKYTRRRRWIRTAELVNADQRLGDTVVASEDNASKNPQQDATTEPETLKTTSGSSALYGSSSDVKQRKSLRFDQ